MLEFFFIPTRFECLRMHFHVFKFVEKPTRKLNLCFFHPGMGKIHGKYWIMVEAAYCIMVACIATLIKFVSKYVIGKNVNNFEKHSGKCTFYF